MKENECLMEIITIQKYLLEQFVFYAEVRNKNKFIDTSSSNFLPILMNCSGRI